MLVSYLLSDNKSLAIKFYEVCFQVMVEDIFFLELYVFSFNIFPIYLFIFFSSSKISFHFSFYPLLEPFISCFYPADILIAGFQGDYEKAGFYYMRSVKGINKPLEFVFPYYGW